MTVHFADWLAICETKARYCRCLDTKDWAGWADCFTEDLVLDTRPAGGVLVEGRNAALRMVRGAIETAKTAHQVHNPEIRFEADGNAAAVIWAMQDRVQMAEERWRTVGEKGHTGYGHYRERYVRCSDGKWRIQASTLSYLTYERDPVS